MEKNVLLSVVHDLLPGCIHTLMYSALLVRERDLSNRRSESEKKKV